jgi:pantoate--beta-alanine ligase
MRVFELIVPLRAYLRAAREDQKSVGFVPTMGALHDGHVALMKKARSECDVVVVSIFVNPSQFGPNEDFLKYPRELKKDTRIAQQADTDAVFAPSVEEIYPGGSQTSVDVPELSSRWEGEFRPGHFRGVATVCSKLFNIVRPDRVYFGQKDYQQLKVIERMVADLHVPTTVVAVPTMRDADGLALSSRNAYLSAEQRQSALCLWRGLTGSLGLFKSGERDANALREEIICAVAAEPTVTLEYAAIADPDTLEPLERVERGAAALVAARIGETRLIDNILLQENGNRADENGRSRS